MKTLVACASCSRQFDASTLAPGSRFRCRCGAVLEVPSIRPEDAAVVRCRSCGAPREEGAASCRYCGSDFTIREQDMETICPSCHARIGNHARFCDRCGTAISPEEVGGEATDRTCPACGPGHLLRSRRLPGESFSVLECVRCAGLWVSAETFRLLREKAAAAADPAPGPELLKSRAPRPAAQSAGPIYRRCPVCSTMMSRFNYGHVSGILLDRCPQHGMWFDASELDAALGWVRAGGEHLENERLAQEERDRAALLRFRVEPKVPEDERSAAGGISPDFRLLPFLVDLFRKS